MKRTVYFHQILFIVLLCLLVSCTNHKQSTSESSYYLNLLNSANDILKTSGKTQAKDFLITEISKIKPYKSPYVKNNTLYLYAINEYQSLGNLLVAAAFSSVVNNDSVRNNPGYHKYLFDLYSKTPWQDAYVIPPYYSKIYSFIGQLFIEEKNYDKAISYLDTAVYIWDANSIAYSEMMFALNAKGQLKKSKEIGINALKNEFIKLDSSGQALIYRKLGWISVEEKELDEAENYYNKSLLFEESKLAREELKYINDLKNKLKK